MNSSSSTQDHLMKIARGADISETIASEVDGIVLIFDGFREKRNLGESSVGWAIRRTEEHYTAGLTQPRSLRGPELPSTWPKPVKTIVKWASGNADLYNHIFNEYLEYDYEYDGRPQSAAKIISSDIAFPASNMPGQIEFSAVVNPGPEPTDYNLIIQNTDFETIQNIILLEGAVGTANITAYAKAADLSPGEYNYTLLATNRYGKVYQDGAFSILPGIGRELTAYDIPFMSGTTYYIDPFSNTNGDGLTEETPFNTWAALAELNGNNNYLQKRGTEYTFSSEGFTPITGPCFIGAYGLEEQARPILRLDAIADSFIYTEFQITLKDLEIVGPETLESDGLVMADSAGSIVFNCNIHHWISCIVTRHKEAEGATWSGIKVLYSTIHHASWTGILLADTTDIEIAHCHIYDVVMEWYKEPDGSFGSCIGATCEADQLSLHIHHCTLDRTTSKKGHAVIYSDSLQTSEGTLNNNYFVLPPFEPGKGVTGVRIDATANNQSIVNNVFKDGETGLSIDPKGGEFAINHNLFTSNRIAIGIDNSNRGSFSVNNNVMEGYLLHAIKIDYITTIKMRNNLFMNASEESILISLNNWGSLTSSDFNHFFNVHFPLSPDLYSLEWLRENGYELDSSDGDPGLMDMSEAHPNYMPAAYSPLIGTGKMIAGVTKDFAGHPIQIPNSKGLYDAPALINR